MCNDSILIPYDSLAVMSLGIMTGDIFLVTCFYGYIFASESAIDNLFFLG